MKVEDRSRDLDFRVSVLPTLWGEKIVLRLLDKTKLVLDMTKLGFEPHSLERFKNAVARPYGMVLVAGPRRSGKTTTLYSAIASLNKPDTNVMTVGDPVELDLPGTNQVAINRAAGETAATVLRSLHRVDADIVLVSEIGDAETARLGFGLAQRGPLVLSTLPTGDALCAVVDLLHLGIDPYLLATTVYERPREDQERGDHRRGGPAGDGPLAGCRGPAVDPERTRAREGAGGGLACSAVARPRPPGRPPLGNA